MNINKVTIVGHLTRDPELKALPSGAKVCNFSIATSRSYTKEDGTKEESVEFHNIICFGIAAENSAKWLKKGQLAGVEGRLQTRSWDGKDGEKRYRTEILAQAVHFGPKPQTRQNAPGETEHTEPTVDVETGEVKRTVAKTKANARPAVAVPGQKPEEGQIEYPSEDIDPADIPF